MEIQNMIHNAVVAKRKEELKTSPQLMLGEFILKLELANTKTKSGEDKEVRFDFGYFYPTSLDSWRGSYEEIALGYTEKGDPPTVEKLLKELKSAIGKKYTGYKGGDFLMSKHTPVWVSNYGECPHTAIVEVLDMGWQVILETKYLPY